MYGVHEAEGIIIFLFISFDNIQGNGQQSECNKSYYSGRIYLSKSVSIPLRKHAKWVIKINGFFISVKEYFNRLEKLTVFPLRVGRALLCTR